MATVARKKSTAAKAAPKKPSARRTSTAAGKKTTAAGKKKTPRTDPAAGAQVARELHAMKEGTLRSGGSGKKVTDPKQAIAIGLSEARRSGAKVPPKPAGRKKPN